MIGKKHHDSFWEKYDNNFCKREKTTIVDWIKNNNDDDYYYDINKFYIIS